MINIIPQSEVRLLKTPLEKDEEHTLAWDTLQEQSAYMLSNVQKTYSDFTYVRDTGTIVVPDNYDTIYTCNYLMYKNNGFNNKYFYAFITKMEYVSENSTRIYFEIDSLQTWYFQINYNNVFIEREHVSDDTIGANTVPENIELGDYIEEGKEIDETMSFNYLMERYGQSFRNRKYYVVMGVSECPLGVNWAGDTYNRLFSGLRYLVFKETQDARYYIEQVQHLQSADSITACFVIPDQFIDETTIAWRTYTDYLDRTIYWQNLPNSVEPVTLQSPYVLKTNKLGNSYIPTNNKLLTYPYKYFVISNNSGQASEYRYEDFSETNCNFSIRGVITVGCGIKLIPRSYKNMSVNYLHTLDAGKLPTCSWINDSYTNWLTSNAVNLGINLASNVALIGAGVATANPAFAVSGIASVAGTIGQVYEHSKIPATAKGGVNCGDFNFCQSLTFTLHKMVIKEEYARIIDNFFTKYGYKVNRVKTPNINSRRNFNYIKTIDCNFTGDLPQEDLEKIKDIFNKGITFWHNAENFLNYSVNNDII